MLASGGQVDRPRTERSKIEVSSLADISLRFVTNTDAKLEHFLTDMRARDVDTSGGPKPAISNRRPPGGGGTEQPYHLQP